MDLETDEPFFAAACRAAFRFRLAGHLPRPGRPWERQPITFTRLVDFLADTGVFLGADAEAAEATSKGFEALLKAIAQIFGKG